MNLSTVKSITIPEGNVTELSIGGVKVWSGGSGGGEPAELYSWEGVAYHINKGTYKDVYAIGDMVPLDLGSEGLINMQIAAFDTDILANGSGTAAISWVAKELLKTKYRMNPKRVTLDDGSYQEGTGTIGGWEKCEVRAHLQNTIKPLIPSTVASGIVSVSKKQLAYDAAGISFNQITADDVWIPSRAEINGTPSTYAILFPDSQSRIKYYVDSGSAGAWWGRNAVASSYFSSFSTTGTHNSTVVVSNTRGVCLGFCTGRTPT